MFLPSVPQLIQLLHALAGAVVVGSQLHLALIVWRPLPVDTAEAIHAAFRLEARLRLVAMIGLLAAAVFGALHLRSTLVSVMLIPMTPYGPLLISKIAGTIVAFGILIATPAVYAGDGHAPRRGPGNVLIGGAVLTLVVFAMSYAIAYV